MILLGTGHCIAVNEQDTKNAAIVLRPLRSSLLCLYLPPSLSLSLNAGDATDSEALIVDWSAKF